MTADRRNTELEVEGHVDPRDGTGESRGEVGGSGKANIVGRRVWQSQNAGSEVQKAPRRNRLCRSCHVTGRRRGQQVEIITTSVICWRLILHSATAHSCQRCDAGVEKF